MIFSEGMRQANKVTNFTNKDYMAAITGMEGLIKKLSDSASTLNTQDAARVELEKKVRELSILQNHLKDVFRSLNKINV